MNERTKELFNKLVVEVYNDASKRGETFGISLESYRGLCESALELRGDERQAFYQILKNMGVCMDWVNAPMDIIADQLFELMYASTWEGRNV